MMMAGQPVLITKRMIWGQGDGPRLRCADSAGAFAQLACWESYNPLARYALIANGGQNHSAMHPGFVCRATHSPSVRFAPQKRPFGN